MICKIKICGLTNASDAALAVQLGADLLGFNFYPPSPRYLRPDEAGEIIAEQALAILERIKQSK